MEKHDEPLNKQISDVQMMFIAFVMTLLILIADDTYQSCLNKFNRY